MDTHGQRTIDSAALLRHPLVRRVADLAAEITSTRLLIVCPGDTGWAQGHGDNRQDLQPAFCKLIGKTGEGGKHCRMCHILMAVSACSGGETEQRCHAGVSVLTHAASEPGSDQAVAVLSSCVMADESACEETRKRGDQLGADMDALRAAFLELPRLRNGKRELLRAVLDTMSETIRTVLHEYRLEQEIPECAGTKKPRADVKHLLENTSWLRDAKPSDKEAADALPLMIQVVVELVQQRPDLPLTVKELAAAGRVTPNHFSTLFHQHVGVPFVEYLTTQRISRAKTLLGNVRLNITEIARLVGYDDPAYFARRFRQAAGLPPQAWRNSHRS